MLETWAKHEADDIPRVFELNLKLCLGEALTESDGDQPVEGVKPFLAVQELLPLIPASFANRLIDVITNHAAKIHTRVLEGMLKRVLIWSKGLKEFPICILDALSEDTKLSTNFKSTFFQRIIRFCRRTDISLTPLFRDSTDIAARRSLLVLIQVFDSKVVLPTNTIGQKIVTHCERLLSGKWNYDEKMTNMLVHFLLGIRHDASSAGDSFAATDESSIRRNVEKSEDIQMLLQMLEGKQTTKSGKAKRKLFKKKLGKVHDKLELAQHREINAVSSSCALNHIMSPEKLYHSLITRSQQRLAFNTRIGLLHLAVLIMKRYELPGSEFYDQLKEQIKKSPKHQLPVYLKLFDYSINPMSDLTEVLQFVMYSTIPSLGDSAQIDQWVAVVSAILSECKLVEINSDHIWSLMASLDPKAVTLRPFIKAVHKKDAKLFEDVPKTMRREIRTIIRGVIADELTAEGAASSEVDSSKMMALFATEVLKQQPDVSLSNDDIYHYKRWLKAKLARPDDRRRVLEKDSDEEILDEETVDEETVDEETLDEEISDEEEATTTPVLVSEKFKSKLKAQERQVEKTLKLAAQAKLKSMRTVIKSVGKTNKTAKRNKNFLMVLKSEKLQQKKLLSTKQKTRRRTKAILNEKTKDTRRISKRV